MTRVTLTICTLLAAAALSGCAGSSSSAPSIPDNSGAAALVNSHIIGPDVLTPDDSGRDTSATFKKFFTDTVNQHSGARWITTNNGGFKQWTLSNSFQSAPKAWVMGANYYNYENDVLQSIDFTIPDGTTDPAVTFYARWQINDPGDQCVLNYWPGFNAEEELGVFEGGQNPSYPGWDKYYFVLPSNFTGFAQSCYLKFTFTSDSTANGWGMGVDGVSVYQTQLNPPINVVATDGTESLSVDITFDHNNAGTLEPAGYLLYAATTSGGPYGEIGGVAYPNTTITHNSNDQVTYFYVVKAFSSGLPNSADSNEDSGFGGP